MRLKIVLILLVALGLSACASKGFNRGALKDQIGMDQLITTDKDIKSILAIKPNLPKPFKLAVYFKQPAKEKTGSVQWRWTDRDKELILEAAKELQGEKVVSEAFPILSSLVANEELKTIRVAAARHGADAVLVVGGAGEVDSYWNNWGVTYLAILPAAFVHGSEADTLFITNAALWDVRNEFLYLTAEAEATTNNRSVAIFSQRNEVLLENAKALSVAKLKDQIVAMVKGIK